MSIYKEKSACKPYKWYGSVHFWTPRDLFLFLCNSNYISEPAQEGKVCPLSSCQCKASLMAAVIWQELSGEACTQGNRFSWGVPEQVQWCVCVCCCVWHSPMCTSHSENFMAVNKFWSKPHDYGLLMQEIKPRWHIRHLFIFSGNKMFPSLKKYIVMFKSMHCIKKQTKKQKTNIKHTWASYNGLLRQASIGFSWWNKIFQSVIQFIRSL